ncbi:hypothetical protein PHET_04633 [Paragonimus heterotremus]|uniref:Uncharacterized protein n=1 Tax=Paragonimus heterotremus TaxID=100268 RepID=A0A8J4SZ42_9TREM|nr:hypothetical protein PHET_04633 [Paragonimus heterotremus]
MFLTLIYQKRLFHRVFLKIYCFTVWTTNSGILPEPINSLRS